MKLTHKYLKKLINEVLNESINIKLDWEKRDYSGDSNKLKELWEKYFPSDYIRERPFYWVKGGMMFVGKDKRMGPEDKIHDEMKNIISKMHQEIGNGNVKVDYEVEKNEDVKGRFDITFFFEIKE